MEAERLDLIASAFRRAINNPVTAPVSLAQFRHVTAHTGALWPLAGQGALAVAEGSGPASMTRLKAMIRRRLRRGPGASKGSA